MNAYFLSRVLSFSRFFVKEYRCKYIENGNDPKRGKKCVRKVDNDDTRESQCLCHNSSCDTYCDKGRRYLVTNECDYRNDASGKRQSVRNLDTEIAKSRISTFLLLCFNVMCLHFLTLVYSIYFLWRLFNIKNIDLYYVNMVLY
jgi:hypothetical protein